MFNSKNFRKSSLKSAYMVPLVAFLLLISPGILLAATDFSDLINTAGKQRLLSQRIAKAYFYSGSDIQRKRADMQLDTSRKIFRINHNELKNKVDDPAIQSVLSFVEFAYTEFDDLVSQPYNRENAALVLDLSETLLETSHDVVLKLEKLSGTKNGQLINISGRQRMLSQRIAKYYIAYKSGFKDENSVLQLEQAIAQFEQTFIDLHMEKSNTELLSSLLTRVQTQWDMVKPQLLGVEKGRRPSLVFLSTDRITKRMNVVTAMYISTVSSEEKESWATN